VSRKSSKYRTLVIVERPRTPGDSDRLNVVDLSDDGKWVRVCRRYAAVRKLDGREFLRLGQVRAEVTHIVELRYDSETKTISPVYRLRLGETASARKLDVVVVDDQHERRVEIQLQCSEKA
jgi:SPP1 family predicted phage head-tail adaptor